MQRIARRTRLHAGSELEYQKMHDEIWPGVSAAIEQAGIRNYAIFRDGLDLFAYFETEDFKAASDFLSSHAESQRWQQALAPLMDAPDALAPWANLETVWRQDDFNGPASPLSDEELKQTNALSDVPVTDFQ